MGINENNLNHLITDRLLDLAVIYQSAKFGTLIDIGHRYWPYSGYHCMAKLCTKFDENIFIDD